jgi:hypothetical protein
MLKEFLEVNFKFEIRDTNGDTHLVARNSIMQPFGRHVWFTKPPNNVFLIVPVE